MTKLDRAVVMRRDFFKLQKAKLRDGDPRIERSRALRHARDAAAQRLDLSIPDELPIAAHADEILGLLEHHQVVIVAGETGSGKTTQLPKLCLAAGLGRGALIGHTQPRRIAARTVAQRIAVESGGDVGAEIGFAVRFSDRTSDATLVKIMTDGLLLAEVRHDRFLDNYDVIIVDEAHERSLNIDFLLGYLQRLVKRRADLKVIITSATIDVDRFAEFFGGAPTVTVGGRAFPVEVRYQEEPEDPHVAIVDVLEEIAGRPFSGARDVLAFFSGEREIFEAARVLRRHFGTRYEVLPLYARLSVADQQRVFTTTGSVRRVVLATNVAETSLTVPNIGYVIDPGFARINRYSYRSKLQRLPIEPISRASADQRMGRCGRIAPGVCYRLYTESDYLGRDAYTDPEIRRVNLASVMLQMQAFRLGEMTRFPFIDPPDSRAVKDAVRLLDELQALQAGKLTAAGRAMARIPVDPRLARMLVSAHERECLREIMIIVSGLAIQDPRERPIEKAQAADSAHLPFQHEKSDFLGFLKLWDWLEAERQANTRNRWQALLRKRFLNVQRVREWREVHRQLKLVCRDLGYVENSRAADYRTIHECIVTGSLSQIAQHEERGQYTGARNLKLRIFPGSALAGKTPKWIVAAEVVETSRVFGRCVAQLQAQWIERQATHLVKRTYTQPHWSLRRGEVMAYENVSLYGLRIVERRAVGYGKIDPDLSRDLFLREGLVHGAINDPPEFLRANLQCIADVQTMEAKTRRRDLLVSDDDVYAFYAERLPASVSKVADLKSWLRGAPVEQVESLFLSEAQIRQRLEVHLSEQDFPNAIALNDVELELKYRFAPGEVDDGISVFVPTGLLHAVGAEPLEWSVPGMLPAVVEQWLRSLPKAKRRVLTPIPDKLDELCERLVKDDRFRRGRFLSALTDLLADLYGIRVAASDWDRSRVADHLLLNIKVVDHSGKVVAQGRDLNEIKSRLLGDHVGPSDAITTLEAITAFPPEEVPEQRLDRSGPTAVMTYPGFVDEHDSVNLQAFTDVRARDTANRSGYPRLALFALGKVGQYFKKELKQQKEMGLHFANLGNADALHDEILRNVVWYCFFEHGDLPRTASAFDARLTERRGDLAEVFATTVTLFARIMRARFEIVRKVDELNSPAYAPSLADIRRCVDTLAPANCLTETPFADLPLLPRYLDGLLARVHDLPGRVPRDRALIAQMEPLAMRLTRLRDAELFDAAKFTKLRFYVEELRLKLFAETLARQKIVDHPLATLKVSAKRVALALTEEERRVGLA